MKYVDGFLCPVPTREQARYREMVMQSQELFLELGATRVVETWGDDVPSGKFTDFKRAVRLAEDEQVVFSWLEYPDRAARDRASQAMRSDPRMESLMQSLPVDGARMVFGGFEPIVDRGTAAPEGYVDGYVVPVPERNRERYTVLAEQAADVFLAHGAHRVVECWGNDVSAGTQTDFLRAVDAQPGEVVVFSWIEWPSKALREVGWKNSMADSRMQPPSDMPFDGKRLIYGGFSPLLTR